jgi:ABC-type polysaccharide/polyol phosphate transport system ATPase subunit
MTTTDDILISLERVCVEYRVPHEKIDTFKEYMVRRLRGGLRLQYETFLALRDVDLTVKRGEVFGIIGSNGAGKSTMLRLVARVLRPTRGRVWVKGKVAPLLELGAGFHPELSGRENVFLNGAILGFDRREMAHRMDSIVDFAELHDFIDAPLRTYSSGMRARLGFAVATDVKPDILVVDEVLSVGDEAFRRKSEARMKSFRVEGTTILLVSHSMEAIQSMCQRALWIDHGQVKALGAPKDVIAEYRKSQT